MPDFTDVQTYLTYDISHDWQVGVIGNYNRSHLHFYREVCTRLRIIELCAALRMAFHGQGSG